MFRNNLSEKRTLSSPFAQAAIFDLLLSHTGKPRVDDVIDLRRFKNKTKNAMYPTVHKVVQTLLYEFNGEIPSELFDTKIKFTKTPAR